MKKRCRASSAACHDGSNYTYKNNNNNSPSTICPQMQSLNWKMIKIWKWLSASGYNLVKSSHNQQSSYEKFQNNLAKTAQEPASDKQTAGFPARCDTAAPQPAVCSSARTSACAKRRQETDGMSSCPPLLSRGRWHVPSPVIVLPSSTHQRSSWRRAWWSGWRPADQSSRASNVERSHIPSQTTANQEL